ncbi:MAG: phospho-N-acetylmuramoyl-pentapeptide-transferase [Acidobacteriota bacterium]|nr:MAG: phospho-N-acetylmuramoyl-pentapeptide-transferase [Acidobacteriota bacterium]
MLYYLCYELLYRQYASQVPLLKVFNVFQYVTFRTAYAAVTALALSLIFGPWVIRKLREFKFGQEIREEGPASHQAKRGTPTMGGVLIIGSVLISTLLWANLRNWSVWVTVAGMLGCGAIGFADDYIKIVRKRSLGLTARQKLAGQILVGATVAALLFAFTDFSSIVNVPFFKNFRPDLTILGYTMLIIFVLMGTSNAVNLTDGLDGLAISVTVIAASALTGLAYVTGHVRFAAYLDLPHTPGVWEVTILGGALVGASLGFLWFNAPAAEVFMGDVGSLGIGGALGTISIVIKQELVLPILGGVFVIEALSVMLQVTSFKLTRRRIFKMAPLHHHFELLGWKEPKIVFRFLIVAILFALLSLSTLKLR